MQTNQFQGHTPTLLLSGWHTQSQYFPTLNQSRARIQTSDSPMPQPLPELLTLTNPKRFAFPFLAFQEKTSWRCGLVLFPHPLCLWANTGASHCGPAWRGLPSFLGNFFFNSINLSKFSLNHFYKELDTNHLIFLDPLATMSIFFLMSSLFVFVRSRYYYQKYLFTVSQYCWISVHYSLAAQCISYVYNHLLPHKHAHKKQRLQKLQLVHVFNNFLWLLSTC